MNATKPPTEPRGHVWEAEDGGLTCSRCGLGYTNLPCVNASLTEPPHASNWPWMRARCRTITSAMVLCIYPWCKCATAAELELASVRDPKAPLTLPSTEEKP